ncbi:multidrug efflux RND transporter subunit MdtA [Uliginosibacterium sediminicola]
MLATLLILALGAGAWFAWSRWQAPGGAAASKPDAAQRGGQRPPRRPTPVQVGAVTRGDVRVYFASLGTVTPSSSVVVRTRVDGRLDRLAFKEGQVVRAGQLLAELDPKPLQVELAQAEGQLAKDQAQLLNARRDLARYQDLLAKDSISRQQVDTSDALVKQYEAVVRTDQAQVDSAKLQLSYTRVVAPVSGLLGLRQVDAGNMVHTSDSAGIVLINQVQPINVSFTLPESQLPTVLQAKDKGESLRVEAWDREQKHMLARGRVAALDNQIDLSTGTVKLKAVFSNEDGSLFPNQFVNVRLLADTHRDVVIAPAAAIQRGRAGSFVYVVKADNSVTQRVVKTGVVDGTGIEIIDGLRGDEAVVTDGIDQLREGAKVEVANPAALLKEKPRGAGRRNAGRRDDAASGPAAAGEAESRPRAPRREGAEAAPAGLSAAAPGPGRGPGDERRANAGARPDWANLSEAQRAEWRARREAMGLGPQSGPRGEGGNAERPRRRPDAAAD